MKRTLCVLAVLVVAALLLAGADAVVTGYTVNGRALDDMSVTELYDLKDSVVASLKTTFDSASYTDSSGSLVGVWVLNTKTKKFHYPYCGSALQIGDDRDFVECSIQELIDRGYQPCGQCNP